MSVYYNENDPFAAAWLRALMIEGEIAWGYVDERSIEDVKPEELTRYTQCHFFAGIGTWSYALRQAGWPDDRPVWTGSPPCQPFSLAGRGGGYDDARHLAPKWLDLVKECLPPVVFGEQVASAFTNKKHHWIDDLQDALEAEGYATGKIVLPACSVGAPHIRQRGWLVAERVEHTEGDGWEERRTESGGRSAASGCRESGAGDASSQGLQEQQRERGNIREAQRAEARETTKRGSASVGGMAEPNSNRRQPRGEITAPLGYRDTAESASGANQYGRASATHSRWQSADWLLCRDGKWRPVEPGTFPLVDGSSARVGRLRGYGNGIQAQVAQEVIDAYLQHSQNCDSDNEV